jgi:hypothetical protein
MQQLLSRDTESLTIRAGNVTGTQDIPLEISPDLSVRSVTDSIAHRMVLPTDVTWTLRDDSSSAFLDEDAPIGDQLERGAHVTITPKAHLGGAA